MALNILERRLDISITSATSTAPPKIFPETIPEAEQKTLDLPRTFSHPLYKFSFNYPAGFTANILPSTEAGGETIVVQNQSKNAGFQIYLEPYDASDTDITKERLAQDIPEMKIKESQEVIIGSSGRGLAFVAADTNTARFGLSSAGRFINTALMENDTLLQRVLNTWNLNKLWKVTNKQHGKRIWQMEWKKKIDSYWKPRLYTVRNMVVSSGKYRLEQDGGGSNFLVQPLYLEVSDQMRVFSSAPHLREHASYWCWYDWWAFGELSRRYACRYAAIGRKDRFYR